MQYKTIIYEMLQHRPQMQEQLRKDRKLLPTLELYAKELKASHEAWKQVLSQMRPDSSEVQIASEALEIAVKELEDRLSSDSSEESEPQVLEAAMLFRHRRTPAK